MRNALELNFSLSIASKELEMRAERLAEGLAWQIHPSFHGDLLFDWRSRRTRVAHPKAMRAQAAMANSTGASP